MEKQINRFIKDPPDLAVVDIKCQEWIITFKKVKKKMSIPIIFLTSKDDKLTS